MKQEIQEFLAEQYPDVGFDVSYPPDGFGDYSTNVAFLLAKEKGENPQKIAEEVKGKLQEEFKEFEKIEIAGDGFINFHLSIKYLLEKLNDFLKIKIDFPKTKSLRINLEFVSANPTGPLTVGNARAASFGDTLGNVLNKVGHQVTKEYYINDIGVQVEKMAKSEINEDLKESGRDPKYKEEGLYMGKHVITGMLETKTSIGAHLFDVSLEEVEKAAVESKIKKIKESVARLGVEIHEWFKESSLHNSGEVKKVLSELESKGYVIEEDGAKWLKLNDDQKAVLVKSNGLTTYLANDIAYTKNKFERGFDIAINIWGADHHGDVIRLKSGIQALGYNPNKLQILLHQLVALKKDGQLVRMSKREGNIETLDDLLNEVGKDVTRFFFLTKDLNTHMEFDMDLAKEQSSKNPVYYIQYAFARISSVFEKSKNLKVETKNLELLKEKEELDLIRCLIRFPEVIFEISQNYQVHHLSQYALELANRFHRFYEKQRIISENERLTEARSALVKMVQVILGEALSLMGIETPKRM